MIRSLRAIATLGAFAFPGVPSAQTPPPVCGPQWSSQVDYPCRLADRGPSCRDVSQVRGEVVSVLPPADVDGDHVTELFVSLDSVATVRSGLHECDLAPGRFERDFAGANENVRFVIERRGSDGRWTGWTLGRAPNGDRGSASWIEPVTTGGHVFFGVGEFHFSPWSEPTTSQYLRLFELRSESVGPREVFASGEMGAATMFAPLGDGDVLACDGRRGLRVLRWNASTRRLVADPSTRPLPDSVLARLRRIPAQTPCALAMRTSFHLRPTRDERSEGPEMPSGTVVLAEERVDDIRRGAETLYRVRLPGGSSGYVFIAPADVVALCPPSLSVPIVSGAPRTP